MLLPGSRHGEGKNETISRIPSFHFSFRAAGKKILHLRYVSLYLSRLNSSPFFPISRVDGVAFERERGRERGRCTDSVSVGNSKISNYPGAQSSVKSSYDVLNFGGTVMPALRVTYRERNLKFIIPRSVFSTEFREG